MKFIDFFAGIGGFREGLTRNNFIPVGWCEIDKFKQKAYQIIHNPKGEWFSDDITTVKPDELPKADLYVGGFPCQSFSIAGKRGGFEDTRGNLFFEIMRLAKARQPKYLLLENVKGLLSHDRGRTFATILNTLWDSGYNAEWQVLNSKDFGVPQNRERIFIIGYLREEPRPKVFPIRRKNKSDIEQFSRGQGVAHAIDANYHKGTSPGDVGKGRRTHIIAQRGRYKDNGKTEQQIEPRQDGVTNTITGVQKDNLLYDNARIRKLTPLETFRLQGFPNKWYYKLKNKSISDTQMYRMAGDAVTVNVVEEIGKRLLRR